MSQKKIARLGTLGFFFASALLVSCSSKQPEMMSSDSTPSPSIASEPAPATPPEPKLVAQNTNLGASSSGYSR